MTPTIASGLPTIQESLTLALDGIIDGIRVFIAGATGIPQVPNPSHPQENLASGWNAKTYPQFVQYVNSVRRHLDELMRGAGIDQMTKSLGRFVGPSAAERAVLAHARETERLRGDRSLRVESRTGLLTTGVGIAIPRNNYYGA